MMIKVREGVWIDHKRVDAVGVDKSFVIILDKEGEKIAEAGFDSEGEARDAADMVCSQINVCIEGLKG